mgnify:CR=1 FL=1
MVRGIRAKSHEKLDDTNLQRVWEALNSSTPITKKEACEMLNITYNTTRLNNILEEHRDTMEYRAKRKASLKGTKATDAEIKQVIAELIQQKTQQLALIEVSEFYVFEYLDPPAVMEQKSEPKRSLICILGAFIGGFLGVIIVILRHYAFKEDS